MNYAERKLAEVNFLRRWVGEPNVSDLPDSILQEKIRLIRRIAAQNFEKYPVMLTNIERRKLQILGKDYWSDYTRQGAEFDTEEPLKLFYPILSDELLSSKGGGYFLKSGQSANYLILMMLFSVGTDISFEIPAKTIYFETEAIFFYLQKRRHNPKAKYKGLIIDSGVTSFEGLSREFLGEHHLYVFDTTCLGTHDVTLAELLRRLLETGKPVILTRSYLKLDSLGVEYGALGSIVVLNADQNSIQLPSEIGATQVHLKDFLRKMASLMGGHSQPHEIYPFLVDPQFLQLNALRLESLKRNMSQVENAIEHALHTHGLEMLTVERYQHRLYCKIRLPQPTAGKIEQAFARIKMACEIEAFNCDSFGFDFLGVCVFTSSQGHEFLRVTTHDADIDNATLRQFFLMIFKIVAETQR